jgi:hypothetical protein
VEPGELGEWPDRESGVSETEFEISPHLVDQASPWRAGKCSLN